MSEQISLYDQEEMISLFGEHDEKLRLIENNFDVNIVVRNNKIDLHGSENDSGQVRSLIDQILKIIRAGYPIRINEIKYAIRMMK